MPAFVSIFFLALSIFSLLLILMAYALMKNGHARINQFFAGLMLTLAIGVVGIMVLALQPPPEIVAVALWIHTAAVCLTTALLALFILELFVPHWPYAKYIGWFFIGASAVAIILLIIDVFYQGNLVFAFDPAVYDGEYIFLRDYLSGTIGALIYRFNVTYAHIAIPVLIAGFLVGGIVQPQRRTTAVSLTLMLILLGVVNFLAWLYIPVYLPLIGTFSIAILATWAIVRHQVLSPINVGLRQALDTAFFGVMVFDPEWKLLESNQTAQKLLAVELGNEQTLFSILESLADDVENKEGVLTFVNDTAVAFAPERTLGIIKADARNESKRRWLYLQFSAIDRDEQPSGYLCIIEDQTAVRQAQDKLETVNKSLEKFAFQATLLNDIIRTAISDVDLDIMLQRFADRLGDMFAAAGCIITTWQEQNQTANPAAAYGQVLDLSPWTLDWPQRISITQTVLDSGQHLVIQDIPHSPYQHLHEQKGFFAHSMLALPLISDQQKIGAIIILFSEEHVITLEDTALGHQAASHIALAISKVLTLKAEREQRELAETLREINLALTSTLDIETILDLVLEQIARVVPYDTGAIYLINEDKIETARLNGFEKYTVLTPEQIIRDIQPFESITTFQTIIREKRPLLIQDITQFEAWISTDETQYIKSWIGVPLISDNQVQGILALDNTETNFYQEIHKETLLIYADQLALALQRAQWYEDSQKWAHQLASLNDISAQMVGMVTVQSLVDVVVNRLCDGFKYPNVIVSIIDWENETEMVVQGMAGIYQDMIKDSHNLRLSIHDGLMGQAVREQKYVLVNDVQHHPDFYQLPGMNIQSELVIPIKIDNEVFGLLNVESEQKDAFNENDVVLLTIIADQLAVALQKVRLFEITGRRAEELEVLSVVSAQLRSAHTTAEMLSVILENTVNVFNANTSVISLIDHDQQLVISRGVFPWGAYPIGLAHRLDEGITGYVARTGKSYISTDLNSDPLTIKLDGEEEFLKNISQCISLPLQTETTILGVFHLGLAKSVSMTSIDVQLMNSIADISANALYRAQVLESLEEHVDKRTLELRLAYARLKELDELKSKFISDVTHELRTPVANLNLYLDLIRMGKPENKSRYMRVIENQVTRLTQIVDNTLQLPRLDSAEDFEAFEPIDLKDLIDTAVTAYTPKAEAKGVSLHCYIPADMPDISGDSKEIDQAIRNVLANAINYTHDGQVTIQAKVDNDHAVCLTIEDSGIGIEEKDMPYIFDRFYRGQKVGQSNIPGMGLGLNYVKMVVEQHNGRIELNSQPKQGTTCTIWLPFPNSHS